MDRTLEQITTDALAEITRREVSLYAATSDTATFYPVLDDEHQTYAVVVVENTRSQSPSSWVFVMARVAGDKIIIEEDSTVEKHLVDALIHNGGIPRDHIILAYKGEAAPSVS